MLEAAAVLTLAIWLGLLLGRGGFWRVRPGIPEHPPPLRNHDRDARSGGGCSGMPGRTRQNPPRPSSSPSQMASVRTAAASNIYGADSSTTSMALTQA